MRALDMPSTRALMPLMPWTSSAYWGELSALIIGTGLAPHTSMPFLRRNLLIWL